MAGELGRVFQVFSSKSPCKRCSQADFCPLYPRGILGSHGLREGGKNWKLNLGLPVPSSSLILCFHLVLPMGVLATALWAPHNYLPPGTDTMVLLLPTLKCPESLNLEQAKSREWDFWWNYPQARLASNTSWSQKSMTTSFCQCTGPSNFWEIVFSFSHFLN